jgi:hypothetical protein
MNYWTWSLPKKFALGEVSVAQLIRRTSKRRPQIAARQPGRNPEEQPLAPGSALSVRFAARFRCAVRRRRYCDAIFLPPLRYRKRRRAIFGGTELAAQIKRTVDQANVAVGLRKVAQHAASRGIELFCEQADVIAARE